MRNTTTRNLAALALTLLLTACGGLDAITGATPKTHEKTKAPEGHIKATAAPGKPECRVSPAQSAE